jgi:P4 family phage/plasmid primase-like protien
MTEVYNETAENASANGRHSLQQIAGALTVLEPFGAGWWRGNCPLCRDQNLSLTVFPNASSDEETFKCESCGESGYVDDFLKLLYSEAPPKARALTDIGNAERLIARHGGDLRYCHAWRKWLIWDGTRWRVDDCGAVKQRAKDTVRSIYEEAGAAGKEGERKALADHAKRSESRQRVEAMISLAESAVPVRPEELDPDPWLLNVSNGTVDFRTGELLAHHRENLITKLAPVSYDRDARAPTFEKFLERILSSEALRRFVQRAIGYAASGVVSEEMLPIFYGVGANGKSTLVNVVMEVLGDYAVQAAPELLLAKRGSHPTELADLFGRRFVASVETDEGRRLAESLVKQLTGRDRIRARRMREDFWEFSPTHTVFLATNHRPEVRGTDHAIWRRIKFAPFEVTIPEEEQDKRLPGKLRAELSGILAWIVRGCLDYQREGLGEPEEVKKATEGYRSEMDVLAAFIEDRCVAHPNAHVGATPLYQAYKEWCEDAGEDQLTQTKFGRSLKERGFRNEKVGVVTWHGIGLRNDEQDPPRGGRAKGDEQANRPHLNGSNPNPPTEESCMDKEDSKGIGGQSGQFGPEFDINNQNPTREAVISKKGPNPPNPPNPPETVPDAERLPSGIRSVLDDPDYYQGAKLARDHFLEEPGSQERLEQMCRAVCRATPGIDTERWKDYEARIYLAVAEKHGGRSS